MKIELPEDYIVWDLETSGFSFTNDYILEVAVARVEKGEVVESWSAIINHDVDIDPKVSEIHGLTREICAAEGQDPETILRKLFDSIAAAPVHVTHNGARFDLPFLAEALQRYGIADFWSKAEDTHIDTAGLYKGVKMGWSKDAGEANHAYFRRVLNQPMKGLKYNVGAACDDLGISREGVQQHRALADVLLTNEIFKKLAI